ncbi:MAG: electron transfer flavoprotein subunit alpha/FixB family protein [Thermodesulfobacteriota bacterium]
MTHKSIILAEMNNQEIDPLTFELLHLAQRLGPERDLELVYPTHADNDFSQRLAEQTGLNVTRLKMQTIREFNPETYKKALQDYLAQKQFSYFLAVNNTRNRDYIPALAHGFGSTCISQVSGIEQGKHKTCFLRPMFAGKYEAVLQTVTETTFLLVQPGSFQAYNPVPETAGKVFEQSHAEEPELVHSLGMQKEQEESEDLKKAQVVVSAGKGITERENLDLVKRTAALFSKGCMACSRPICDMGWLDYKYQVGETGATVSPEVYIACGISGSMQHISGMSGSQLIVAINKDSGASIFNYSDICIQEDVKGFLETFLEIATRQPEQD